MTQLFDTAGKTYILPPHRFTVYAMGILLGYILRKYKDIKLTQTQLTMGWYISTGLLLSAFCAPAPMGTMGYKFNPTHAAHYAAFAPIGWCLFFAWIIFTSQLGYKSKENTFHYGLKYLMNQLQINSQSFWNGKDFKSQQDSHIPYT